MTKAYESAVRLLARREHGAIELSDKLKLKGFNITDVNDALSVCQRLDLQSDRRYVESFTRLRIRQGYGPLKINQELNSKGIDKELIVDVLRQEDEHWLNHALTVWQKKTKGRLEMSFSDLQKNQRFLLYRGFGMDVIARVVNHLELVLVESV